MIAPLLGLVVLFPQVSVVTVDDALRVTREGGSLPAMSRAFGREAAKRLDPRLELDDVEALTRIARQAKALPELGVGLAALLADGDEKLFSYSVGELASLPAEVRDAAALKPHAIERLLEAAHAQDPEFAAAAVVLLMPRAQRSSILELFDEWAVQTAMHGRARHLLKQVARAPQPADLFVELAGRTVHRELRADVAAALRALAGRDSACVDAALEMVASGELGAGGEVIRALGAVRFSDEKRWEAAAQLLEGLLAEVEDDLLALDGDVLASTLAASGELLVPAVVPLLPSLALHAASPDVVRAAALEAMGRVCYRDAPTIDLMIGLLDDKSPAVASAAYEALRRRSGQSSLPQRSAMWVQWREQTVLPEQSEDPLARLATQRAGRASSERLQDQRDARKAAQVKLDKERMERILRAR